MQQVRCVACKHQWSVPLGDGEPLFSGIRNHLNHSRLLKAIALLVAGLPLDSVEKLLKIKAETLKTKVISLLQAERWEMLDRVLEERFRMPKWDRSEFFCVVVAGMEFDARSAFRCWG